MTGNEYQDLAGRTLIDKPEKPLTDQETMQIWCAVGLSGGSRRDCRSPEKSNISSAWS